MLSKNNVKLNVEKSANKNKRYSLKKLSVGVASVAVGSSFLFNANQVSADEYGSAWVGDDYAEGKEVVAEGGLGGSEWAEDIAPDTISEGSAWVEDDYAEGREIVAEGGFGGSEWAEEIAPGVISEGSAWVDELYEDAPVVDLTPTEGSEWVEELDGPSDSEGSAVIPDPYLDGGHIVAEGGDSEGSAWVEDAYAEGREIVAVDLTPAAEEEVVAPAEEETVVVVADNDDDAETVVVAAKEESSSEAAAETTGERLPDTATSAWALGLLGLSSLAGGALVAKKED